jgi:hypothetical protein
MELTQPPQAWFHGGAAGAPRQPLQHHTPIGDLASHQRPGQCQPPLLGQLRLTPGPMAIPYLQRLKAPDALSSAAEIGNRDPPSQAGADQLGGELHLSHHQNLIQQGQTHAIKLLFIAFYHQLLAFYPGGAVGAEQVQGAHTDLGR